MAFRWLFHDVYFNNVVKFNIVEIALENPFEGHHIKMTWSLMTDLSTFWTYIWLLTTMPHFPLMIQKQSPSSKNLNRIKKDKSDQIFMSGLTCWEHLQKNIDFHDTHFCNSPFPYRVKSETICKDKIKWLTLKGLSFMDPHNCIRTEADLLINPNNNPLGQVV